MYHAHHAKPHQQDWWNGAASDHQANEDFYAPPGLVERVIQSVWKQLGLPAREALPQPLPEDEGRLLYLLAQDDASDSRASKARGFLSFLPTE